jgi:mannose-6-phosphate isomerase-like protein (cupin superfamily)
MTTSHDLLLKPGQGNSLSVVGDIFTFKTVSEDTNGQYTLVELRVDPGIGPSPHIHYREDEAFYIQEGELEFQLGDQTVIATPGRAITPRHARSDRANFGSSTQVRHRIHRVN